MNKKDIKSMSVEELKKDMVSLGEKPFRASQVFEWIHARRVYDFSQMTNLSLPFREKLDQHYEITRLTLAKRLVSKIDHTHKYLFQLSDGNVIESVLMKYKYGLSLCVSSQIGCRMGCRFCASTLDGLARNLTASEMLEQVYQVQSEQEDRICHIVIMGMGEPLDNYDQVIKFIRLLIDERGLKLSARNITLSTCGVVPAILDLANEQLPVTLALSLHAPNDEKRSELMPVANRYPLAQTLAACDHYFAKTGRRISYEYSLVRGVNDNLEEARLLIKLLKGKNCHVNLIPVNPIKERNFTPSLDQDILKFKNLLEKSGINVTIRREMGQDIAGACGQLRRGFKKA